MIGLARRLRELRRVARLTLDDLAERTHYGKSTLSAAAKGLRLPSWEVTWAYVSACDPQQSDTVWLQRWRDAEQAERGWRAAIGATVSGEEKATGSLEEFAAALRAQIRASGHSLASAAKAAGYPRSTVAKDARGQSLGNWPRVRDVLQAVGVGPAVIEREWLPRWEEAQRTRQTGLLRPVAQTPEAAEGAPIWLRTAQALVWPQLQIRDPMSGRGQSPLIDAPFTDAGGNLSDSWELINGPRGGPVLNLAGRGDDIADIYRALASRRLVLLGAPGAGTSNLARRLGLELVRGERPEPLVPILLPLESWKIAEHEPFAHWFDRQVDNVLDALATPVRQNHALLPILDGFQAVPAEHRPKALAEINAVLSPEAPVVLTGTLEAYAAAVEAADTVLTASAAVHLLPLDSTALAAFLPRSQRNPEQATRAWEPVWRAPLDQREEDLLAVLTAPALAATARHLYSETRADPGELLDATRLPDQAALRARLVEHGISLAYMRPGPTGEEAETSGSEADSVPSERHVRALNDVIHDISFDTSTSGIRLSTVRPRVFAATALATVLTAPLMVLSLIIPALMELVVYRSSSQTAAWQIQSLVACVGVVLVTAWQTRSDVHAYRLRRRGPGISPGPRPDTAPSQRRALVALCCLAALSLVWNITGSASAAGANDFTYEPPDSGSGSAAIAALLAPLAYLLSKRLLTEPAPDTDYPTPAALHRADLNARIAVGLVCTTVLTLSGLDIVSLAALTVIVARSALLRYVAVSHGLRMRMRIPGLTPLRVLNDACDRGLLHRSKSVYHFPHPAYANVLTHQPPATHQWLGSLIRTVQARRPTR
ncbi:helix-turn-helix domain-containing protein [Streptomyces cellostaticus]|uniref:helix-turn-helix domain-containing protein n=1 Tax=Streptomyces cellostaticus TaxID=67285 RepID=UPI00202698B6|nr:helix-turn-helix domain-containing protein [Streptomyces cellostaticus]